MSDENTDVKVIWRSVYEMAAQCGDKSAVDTLSVTGFSDGVILADYSPYTGSEQNKTFYSKAEAVEWIADFFADDDLELAVDCEYDFRFDLDDDSPEESKAPELTFSTIDGASVTLRVLVLKKVIVATCMGIIVRCDPDAINIKPFGAAFFEMGTASFNISEETARSIQVFLGKTLGLIFR